MGEKLLELASRNQKHENLFPILCRHNNSYRVFTEDYFDEQIFNLVLENICWFFLRGKDLNLKKAKHKTF